MNLMVLTFMTAEEYVWQNHSASFWLILNYTFEYPLDFQLSVLLFFQFPKFYYMDVSDSSFPYPS